MFGWELKSGGIKKVSLYKFTHIFLLKYDVKLKQKSDKQPKIISNHLNLLKNKNHVQKKITSKPKKRRRRRRRRKQIYIYEQHTLDDAYPVNQKKKKKEKRERRGNVQEKKKKAT